MGGSKHRISSVEPGSVAHAAGIAAGDVLVSIDGKPVLDVFDYRTRTTETTLRLTIEGADGTVREIAVDKDEYEDLGLEFDRTLMDRERSCKNKCVFCFVDQLPPNLRRTLYFKDDDLRLSFLTGNYVTLTNLTDSELDRLISYRLSPMNISVHTTHPELRVRMLGNRHAGRIMEQLRRIAAAGISLNTQIVLCPGINDGAELERTLDDLEQFGDAVQSIALVPVGLTGHRGDRTLSHITPFGGSTARKVLETVVNRQQKYLQTLGRRLVFAADELYIKAGVPMPPADDYEDFCQLENGVGTVALFMDEMRLGIARRRKRARRADHGDARPDMENARLRRVLMVTGVDAAPVLGEYTEALSALYGVTFEVRPVVNRFFGETVTVAGLVTGGDIVRTLAEEGLAASDGIPPTDDIRVLVPDLMLRHSKDMFLDDMTFDVLQTHLNVPVLCVPPTGSAFLETLDALYGPNGKKRSGYRNDAQTMCGRRA